MYLNLNRPYQINVPRFVNLRVSGFTKSVYELEKDTGLILDTSDILKEIVDCLKDRVTATVELELYCLSMMDTRCHSGIEDEVKQIIQLFIETGKLIYSECVEHGLYTGDELGFDYSNSVMDNLVFIDRRSLLNTLRDEFNPTYVRIPRLIETRW